MSARIIAIANQKGGVGKTTTSVNLSAALALAGKRVLLVDFDDQANASSGVGIDWRDAPANIYQAILGEVPLRDAIIPREPTGLHAVSSTQDLAGANVELVDQPRAQLRLKDALEPVRADFDFVLIDCPPALGLLTVNALCAADALLIPMQAEYFALEGLSRILGTLKRLKETYNPALLLDGILLTMYDARNNLTSQVEAEVRKHFPNKVYTTVIPRSVRLSEAPGFGQPILLYDPKSRGAQAYLDLAQEFLVRDPARDPSF